MIQDRILQHCLIPSHLMGKVLVAAGCCTIRLKKDDPRKITCNQQALLTIIERIITSINEKGNQNLPILQYYAHVLTSSVKTQQISLKHVLKSPVTCKLQASAQLMYILRYSIQPYIMENKTLLTRERKRKSMINHVI